MAQKRSIQDFKEEIINLRNVTHWDDIEINKVYHIPPIISLERRDILIMSKKGDSCTYRKIGDKEQKERTMFKTSVFAKFLVRRKRF